ncbi:hypothetical protein EDD21DRAFT_351712 [Dissophora ornata]|nr:hypothetical protein EDD21DRAFT_351712 [Dissophora ornata]
MAPHCVVDPVECGFVIKSVRRYKRAAPPPSPVAVAFAAPSDGTSDASSTNVVRTENVMTITAAVLGSLLLVLALVLFSVCVKRKRAARRISQLQEFMPTFMDEKSTEEYFKKQATAVSSASTLVAPPTNVHHRTRSAPVAFAKGVRSSRDDRSENQTIHGEQLQQISLTESDYAESENKVVLKRSLSRGSRNGTLTITVPATRLHRSVSLNNHGTSGYISRSPPIDEEGIQDPSDADALPTPTKIRFAEGENSARPSLSREHNNPNRFSAGVGRRSHRRSSSVMEFDPSQFTNTSVMFDSRRLPARTGAESSDESDDDDTVSTASSDGFDHLPAHQKYQKFEAHNPYVGGGDKQELEDGNNELEDVTAQGTFLRLQGQERAVYIAPPMPARTRAAEGIAFRRNEPMAPSRITPSRMHREQGTSPETDNVGLEASRSINSISRSQTALL